MTTIDQYIVNEAAGVEQRGKPMLLTCPFCGNAVLPAVWVTVEKRYAVFCHTDEFFGPRGKTQDLANQAWNTRYEDHC